MPSGLYVQISVIPRWYSRIVLYVACTYLRLLQQLDILDDHEIDWIVQWLVRRLYSFKVKNKR